MAVTMTLHNAPEGFAVTHHSVLVADTHSSFKSSCCASGLPACAVQQRAYRMTKGLLLNCEGKSLLGSQSGSLFEPLMEQDAFHCSSAFDPLRADGR